MTPYYEFCEGALDDSEPWRRGMDGCGAHKRCVDGWLRRERAADRRLAAEYRRFLKAQAG